MRRPLTTAFAVLSSLSLLAACGGDDDVKSGAKAEDTEKTSTTKKGSATKPTVADSEGELQAADASYDLAAGAPGRFLVGMFNEEKGAVAWGTAKLAFFFLGEKDATGTPQPGPTAEGTYLALPGSSAPPADRTKAIYLSSADKGVYEAQVTFDKPGIWGVSASLDLDGSVQTARIAFQVLAKHEVPVEGEMAPATNNLTMDDASSTPAAVDSRASKDTPVPDAELHQKKVADSLAAKRPVLLVISTPTFCVSRFCGPITDDMTGLAKTYANRADFIHIEVWKDFEAKTLNPAASEWISRGENVQEPWVFLIGADGKIARRWDNVATGEQIEPMLKTLPVIGK